MNNFDFWEEYLEKIKKEIIELCNKKEKIQVDLHIHSTYSADGKQTVKEILETTKNKGFDIIAITDHDTLNAYDEIYDYVKDNLTSPIIIPGIEFTIDNREYGNQCHLLQLFVNPKDNIILKDVNTNYQAMFNRSKIQFKRINENMALNEIILRENIIISYEEYKKYLIDNKLVPEYDTLCSYLIKKFKDKKVNCFEVLTLLEKYNQLDPYLDRKQLKEKQYLRLRGKYPEEESNYYNTRFLLSMLAPKKVDDDWWDKPSSGSLSVNSFGQLHIGELNEKYHIYFAHPEEKSLKVVEDIIKSKSNIVGMELNIRSEYENIDNFYQVLNKYNMIKTIGSDSHDASLKFYDNLDFYKIESNEIKKMIDKTYE